MKTLVGVMSRNHFAVNTARVALLCDKLKVFYQSSLDLHIREKPSNALLEDHGVLEFIDRSSIIRTSGSVIDPTIEKLRVILSELADPMTRRGAFRKVFKPPYGFADDPVKPKHVVPARAAPFIHDFLYDELTRQVMALSPGENEEIVPLRGEIQDWESLPYGTKASVLSIVLKQVPTPKPDTPIEQILDFKRDEDNERKLHRLRLWMQRVALEERRPIEIEQELQEGLFEYQECMRIHKMEFKQSKMEAILTPTAEVLENLARLKFSSVVKTLFSLKKRDVEFLKAEASTPGKKFAYIHATGESLS